ncbi:unnamed protein product [Mytilus coruscus]|uniref:B box-type domain-containing protein n=1 Tax=Mytilus coruscus TaxID=42192 RepID=A0A6J8DEH5_MYTCO|nr:unnamed protein product [Mytilus coruscus]
MATNWSVCGICDFREITKPSVVWCSECDEGLCENCKEYHRVSKASRKHEIVSIDQYRKLPSEILQIAQSCRIHNEKYHIYCQKHDCPCCKICIVEIHKECDYLRDINDVVKNVKSSVAFLELESTLTEVVENIRRICSDSEENLSSLADDKKRIVEDVKRAQAALHKHFDKIKDKILNELEAIEEGERNKIREKLNIIRPKEKEIEEYRSSLSSIKQYASDLHTFLVMKQIENDVKDKVEAMQSISQGKDLNKTKISCIVNLEITDVSSTIQNFGKIVIDTKPSNIAFDRHTEKQAQMMVLPTKSIHKLKLTLKQTVKTFGENATGCFYLPNGKMVFSHYTKGGLQILNSDGSKDFDLPKLSTFDVVYNEKDNTLFVTTGNMSRIIHVDITNKKIKKTVKLKTRCFGVGITEETLVYCASDKGLQRLNLRDESISTIISEHQNTFSYVELFGQNLYHFNTSKQILTCCDLNSRITHWKFQYKNILQDPCGITVDDYGNVYVVGYHSINVVVISPDGHRYRELLSKKDGLNYPKAIHYDRTSNKLLVTNRCTSTFLFDVNNDHEIAV